MSTPYIKEYAEPALLALQLAHKEAAYLAYTHGTLFQRAIDLAWVESLPHHPELAEKIDAFVSRFGRLQDHIGEKLIPFFAQLLGDRPKSLIDTLVFAERMGWVESAEQFIALRRLRNLLVHEYMHDTSLFLESLQSAKEGALTLHEIVERIELQAKTIGLGQALPGA